MRAQHYAIWTAWILGVALILMSNAGVIDARIGWGGFWIAVAASLISRLPFWSTKPPASPNYTPDEIREFVAEYTRRLDAGNEPRWELLRDRGIWRQSLGEWNESVTDLTESLQLNSSGEAQARLRRGAAFCWIERFADAVDDLSFGIEKLRGHQSETENLSEYYYLRACAWLSLREFESAIADVHEIAVLGTIKPEHLVVRGQALIHCFEYSRALEEFRKAAKLDPTCAAAWNGIAYVLSTASDDKIRNGTDAVRCAQRACELTGWSEWHHLSAVAGAWAECGDFDKAIEYAERALELAPDFEKPERRERIEQYRRGQPYRHDRTTRICSSTRTSNQT